MAHKAICSDNLIVDKMSAARVGVARSLIDDRVGQEPDVGRQHEHLRPEHRARQVSIRGRGGLRPFILRAFDGKSLLQRAMAKPPPREPIF